MNRSFSNLLICTLEGIGAEEAKHLLCDVGKHGEDDILVERASTPLTSPVRESIVNSCETMAPRQRSIQVKIAGNRKNQNTQADINGLFILTPTETRRIRRVGLRWLRFRSSDTSEQFTDES